MTRDKPSYLKMLSIAAVERHDVRVATGMYGSSREIAALGLGCADPAEIYEKWRQALAKPFEARQVASAPVQEIALHR